MIKIHTKLYPMTKLYLLFGFLLLGSPLLAQHSIPREINATGGMMSNGEVSLTYLVGSFPGQSLEERKIHLHSEILVTFSPRKETVQLVTGTEDYLAEDLPVIYPNPAQDVLYYRSDQAGQAQAKVYNSQGQLVLRRTLWRGGQSLDVSALPPGSYQLVFTSSYSPKIFSYKLIKR